MKYLWGVVGIVIGFVIGGPLGAVFFGVTGVFTPKIIAVMDSRRRQV